MRSPRALVTVAAVPFGYSPDPVGVTVMLGLLALLTIAVSAWSSGLGLVLGQIGSLAAVVTGLQLPLTLLSGIYGMNIIVHPHTEPEELAGVLVSMIVVAAGVLWWARRQGWW